MEEGVVLADGASFAVCYLLLAAVVVRLECRAWEGGCAEGKDRRKDEREGNTKEC